ncbi:flagellar hook protein FlgE [Aquipseudomonas guryensis]|jgi:flagellar hook protein FlgE|uniref:Flagellar hook protein FlgE n=1 Tax=Aquipseudomonas guryensis TaxID=2759165 RepID=A0A7W4DBL9_9GAMM|nr:flagellar hook protein FlgE [Pseudomonas guryensis]MBB1519614.1 flagellar hook protein FlgE [Pseudomonas guryensis]
MGFNIGLSGLRAATSDLNVTGNNIANAGTAGFKQSRAEFADVYAASVLGSGSNPQGSGVLLGDVSQLFNQGNINYTQNALDLAINGNGFFQTSNNGEVSYTRAGYFGTDRDGYMVNNFGYRLQGYTVDANGNLQNGIVDDLRIQTASQQPQATSTISQVFNLNSTNVRPGNAGTSAAPTFDPADPLTYNSSTSLNIYDSQGNSHVMTQYFVKDDATAASGGQNTWVMHVLIDGLNPLNPQDAANTPLSFNVAFDTSGQLSSITDTTGGTAGTGYTIDPLTNEITFLSDTTGSAGDGWIPATVDTTGASPTGFVWNGALGSTDNITFDPRGTTQNASAFSVSSVSQNGYTTGQLSGLEIDDTGVIFARYTNGQSLVQGQVVLANFANVQGLTPVGKTAWVQSFASGEPVVGTPRSGTLGALQSGALEDSNVELSDQLVNLIVAQRNYQANAKTIETESAITQTIINLR